MDENIFRAVCDAVHLQEVITAYTDVEFNKNKCRCMFHNDCEPSFSIYGKNGRELWHCFGCGIGGDAVSWVERYFNLKPLEAVRKLNNDFRLGLKVGGRLSKADRQRLFELERQRKIETAWRSWQRQHELSEIDKVKALEQEKKQADAAGNWEKSAQLQSDIDFIDYQLESISDRTESEWIDLYCSENGIQSGGDFMQAFAMNEGIENEDKEEGQTRTAEKELLTPEVLSDWMQENGISIRYNETTKRMEISGLEEENQELIAETVVTILRSRLQTTGKFRGASKENVSDFLAVCGSRQAYNPVLEYLDRYQWDGKSRLPELYENMNIAADDDLSRVLIKKWLMQCIAILHNKPNEPYGCDGCLTLCGNQGIGKTSLFRKLAIKPNFFKEGLVIDTGDKDTIIRAVGCWIGEVGEVESTLRKDIERLKSFLTSPEDEIRIPYGRVAPIVPRRTSFCATCNSTEFLVDTSGNRRFWTIHVDNINLDKLEKLNVTQLWGEIQAAVQAEGLQSFRLTKSEQKQLADRNSQHTKKVKAQVEVEDILGLVDTKFYNIVSEYQTTTEFRDNFSSELGKFTVDIVAKALEAVGIHAEIKKINGKTRRVRLLPKRFWK